MTTQTIQDYLKTIYELSGSGGAASTNALASRLGVTPASITGMIQRMADGNPPLVNYQKHHGVKLTQAGELVALEVIRHHRLIETYLAENLGYSWDKVHEEADRLEHVISEDFEARIAAILGDPQRDPHGELIPTADLTMPDEPAQLLSGIKTGSKVDIIRVRADDMDILRHLGSLGLVPGVSIEVIDHSRYDNNLTISLKEPDRTIVIGQVLSNCIFVLSNSYNGS